MFCAITRDMEVVSITCWYCSEVTPLNRPGAYLFKSRSVMIPTTFLPRRTGRWRRLERAKIMAASRSMSDSWTATTSVVMISRTIMRTSLGRRRPTVGATSASSAGTSPTSGRAGS